MAVRFDVDTENRSGALWDTGGPTNLAVHEEERYAETIPFSRLIHELQTKAPDCVVTCSSFIKGFALF